jgi:hypothetical protein
MFFNVPNKREENLFVFTGDDSNGNSWRSWSVPPAASYVSIIAIGAGGNGGLGRQSGGSNRGGGGGGGSGGISKAIFPARVLPSTLFLLMGGGGNGSGTIVSAEPSTASDAVFLKALDGSNGVEPTSTNAGAGAAGGVAATLTDCSYVSLAMMYNLRAGVAGTAGGTGVAGGETPAANPVLSGTNISIVLSGGSGGGGSTGSTVWGNGGAITATGIEYMPLTISGGTGNSGGAGNPGSNGVFRFKPHLFGTGGTGGGAGSTTYGYGGKGAYGCGGGGGGTTSDAVAVDPNAYGPGGAGLVILKFW